MPWWLWFIIGGVTGGLVFYGVILWYLRDMWR